MKKFAFFLPQFHEIKENNEWWGKGFTEWVNVKNAKSLYKDHVQPKHPINNNYYNLLDKKTMIHQTKLLNDYNIDGLIYYHYYFTGKKLLEKPAENLLKWKDINQKFFFCWANHSWIRSWDGTKEILIKQEYGKKRDWEEHFQYLLQFFKDERYEKKNNKPLLMLFFADFSEKKEMFEYFNKRCIESGFEGLLLIESSNYLVEEKDIVEKTSYEYNIFLREPTVGINLYNKNNKYIIKKITDKINKILSSKFKFINYVKQYDGNKIITQSINNYKKSDKIIHGLFFEWDNTPRHGKRGYVIEPINKKSFIKYMDTIKKDDYVFINAWNEWAEGMILEGTKETGYKYLEWISEYKDVK